MIQIVAYLSLCFSRVFLLPRPFAQGSLATEQYKTVQENSFLFWTPLLARASQQYA